MTVSDQSAVRLEVSDHELVPKDNRFRREYEARVAGAPVRITLTELTTCFNDAEADLQPK